MKTWKVTIDEEELKALINHHAGKIQYDGMVPERSARIHDLVKRLNKDTPDIDNKDDQQPNHEVKNTSTTVQPTGGW